MKYYFGAYYLLKLKPLEFGDFKGQKVVTGSSCLNESYFDSWSLSWTRDGKNNLPEVMDEFEITKSKITQIQLWADEKFNEKKLGWTNTFNDLNTLIEYKNKFLKPSNNFVAIAIFFHENAVENLLEDFKPMDSNLGTIGIYDNLKNKELEKLNSDDFLGYDIIGIEVGGHYHSFHCYNIWNELAQKFGLTLNQSGLINEFDNKKGVLKYVNNPDNGLPYIYWYLIKVRQIEI